MSTRLVVDGQNQLLETREPGFPEQPAPVRVGATIISYIFHPIFVPLFAVYFMLYLHPYLFAGFTEWDKTKVMIQAFVMFSFFPIVTVLLLKALNFINSLFLTSQKDRVIPLVACMIWYFWIWNVWHNLPEYPKEAAVFTMAIFIASIFSLMLNVYMKISLHSISMGVLVTFIGWLALTQNISLGAYLSASFILAGLVCTARLIVSDHSQKEVYGGFIAGVASLPLAFLFA